METIHVKSEKPYPIYLGEQILDGAGMLLKEQVSPDRAVIVSDSNVAALYGARVRRSLEREGIQAALFTFPAGEKSKSHQTLCGLYAFLLQSGLTRKSALIALGGGVTGDLTGFAAGTYMRGIPYVQVPTSLLSMIDSSIGGKTGIDLKEGKNLVGVFWPPAFVIADTALLETLPQKWQRDGMAEAVKHGAIQDTALFEGIGQKKLSALELVRRNILVKKEIVEEDERESGVRMLLNFGHTLGHAIEFLGNFSVFSHGEAIALGMEMITKAGEKRGLTKEGTCARLTALLRKEGLLQACPYSAGQLICAVLRDKKREGEKLSLILLEEIGRAKIYPVAVTELAEFLFYDEREGEENG